MTISISEYLRSKLDSDDTAESVVSYCMAHYGVSRDAVATLWNNMLCAKHGI